MYCTLIKLILLLCKTVKINLSKYKYIWSALYYWYFHEVVYFLFALPSTATPPPPLCISKSTIRTRLFPVVTGCYGTQSLVVRPMAFNLEELAPCPSEKPYLCPSNFMWLWAHSILWPKGRQNPRMPATNESIGMV